MTAEVTNNGVALKEHSYYKTENGCYSLFAALQVDVLEKIKNINLRCTWKGSVIIKPILLTGHSRNCCECNAASISDLTECIDVRVHKIIQFNALYLYIKYNLEAHAFVAERNAGRCLCRRYIEVTAMSYNSVNID